MKNKDIRKEILDAIESSPEDQVVLQSLNIQDGELEKILSKILEIRPNIESLYLNKNQLGPKSGKLLSAYGSKFSKLMDLNLVENQLGSEGIRAAFTLLEKNPKIRFAFHGNGVETEEMEQLKGEARQKIKRSGKAM